MSNKLDNIKRALLIVDVQNGFINENTKHIPKMIEGLIEKYEHVYATRFYNERKSLYRKLIKWEKFDFQSHDFELAFTPSSFIKIIDKSGYSCIDINFIRLLNNNGITVVDVCGIDTDICVTKCTVDLFEYGIEPRVLTKYCASTAGLEAHENAVKTLVRYIGSQQVIR